MDEGYIKYNCIWIKAAPIPSKELIGINAWRQKLFSLGLIGAYKGEIGFGNISIRVKNSPQFIISGTQTGHIQSLKNYHYTLVTEFNIKENSLVCKGPIKASSESLTHAAIYTCDNDIKSVIHIHNNKLWNELIYKVPTTSLKIQYGTPEMYYEVIKLYDRTMLEKKILVMAGHEDGIMSFGKNLKEAGSIILHYLNQDAQTSR
jgi:class II aldolase/adducin N-terminal domain-containing protein